MSDPEFFGGLASVEKINGSISVSSIDTMGMIDVRGNVHDRKFTAAMSKTLGFSLPTEPRSSAGKGKVTSLWLSPDQWLITAPRTQTDALAKKLQEATASCHSLIVDVSDARSIIRLEGKGAREILMKGAPVNLISDEITIGYVRRIGFAELAALVHVVSQKPEIIDLYVFRSYVQYTWEWLAATSTGPSQIDLFTQQSTAAV